MARHNIRAGQFMHFFAIAIGVTAYAALHLSQGCTNRGEIAFNASDLADGLA